MTDFPPGSGYQPQDPRYQQPAFGYQQPAFGYQQAAPGYALPQQRVRPGWIWYLVSLAVFAAGVAWLVYGVLSLIGTINGLQRVTLPAGTVNLTHSGGYTVYYEGPGAQSGNIPYFHVRFAPTTAVVSLQRYGSILTYNIGSHQGRAVLTLNVKTAGRYAVTSTGAPAGADLAFGGSIGSGIVGTILPAIPLIILGLVGGIIVLIIRIVRKRALRQGYARAFVA